MTTSREANRTALIKARETRTTDYTNALAERDAAAEVANRPEAEEFDRFALRRAEARVESALRMLNFWGDPVPGASAHIDSTAAGPVAPLSPVVTPAAVDSAEAVAARVLASDRTPGEGRKDGEVDAIAARIAAA